jgi:hypothetical protein
LPSCARRLALAVAALILLPTVAFGASFPLAVAAPSQAPEASRTGLVAAANTVGAIAGTVLGPLLLVPVMGTQNLLLGMGAVSALAGSVLGHSYRLRAAGVVVAAAVVAEAALVPKGTVLRGAAAVSEGVIEQLRESASATVVVRRLADASGSWRSLELNGVNVAGTSPELAPSSGSRATAPPPRPPRRSSHRLARGHRVGVAQHRVDNRGRGDLPRFWRSPTRLGDVGLRRKRTRVRILLAAATLCTRESSTSSSPANPPRLCGQLDLYTAVPALPASPETRGDLDVATAYSLTESTGDPRAYWEVFPSTCVWYDPVVLNSSL